MCYPSYKVTTNYLRLLKFSSHLSKNTVYSTLIPKDSLNTLEKNSNIIQGKLISQTGLTTVWIWKDEVKLIHLQVALHEQTSFSPTAAKMSLHWHARTLTVPQHLKSKKITLLSCFYKASLMFKVSEFSTILFTQIAQNDWIYMQYKKKCFFHGFVVFFLWIQGFGLFLVFWLLSPNEYFKSFSSYFILIFTQDSIISPNRKRMSKVWTVTTAEFGLIWSTNSKLNDKTELIHDLKTPLCSTYEK